MSAEPRATIDQPLTINEVADTVDTSMLYYTGAPLGTTKQWSSIHLDSLINEAIAARVALLASLLAGSAEEAALLTEALAGGPGSAAWGVYADWCEDCGRGAKADWLRGVKP